MTKLDIINEISSKTGIEKTIVEETVNAFLETVKKAMTQGNNIYFRGFGSFILKKRAKKIARNISQNTTITVPEHYIPFFKPCKEFKDAVKKIKI
ncbi:MAG: integration host factor subunit beta [Bacteroidales bacterium]|nr:integration host factor subunit beta [Bacteroidales bacterium]